MHLVAQLYSLTLSKFPFQMMQNAVEEIQLKLIHHFPPFYIRQF